LSPQLQRFFGIHRLPAERSSREALVRRYVFDDTDQSIRVAVRKGSKQNKVDDAENRDVRAYPEGECENCDRGEAWILPQCAERVLNILDQSGEKQQTSNLAMGLAKLRTAPSFRRAVRWACSGVMPLRT
jgi:hypothetical protein